LEKERFSQPRRDPPSPNPTRPDPTPLNPALPTAPGALRIAELFVSRQGEGKLTGTESYFIRTSGCNLRCWFCDTPYASWNPSGSIMTIDAIVESAVASGRQHVVLTGGEPLVPHESVTLCQRLRSQGFHVTIETAGTVARQIPCDLMSISPKFASSAPAVDVHPRWHQLHQQRRMPFDVMQSLIAQAPDHQLKFVVDSQYDFPELTEVVRKLGTRPSDVWVMPQGTTVAALDAAGQWLQPWCAEQGFQYCDRQQIRWYGNRRGT
jgi:7-carboxy-7-deazaguanine synthase